MKKTKLHELKKLDLFVQSPYGPGKVYEQDGRSFVTIEFENDDPETNSRLVEFKMGDIDLPVGTILLSKGVAPPVDRYLTIPHYSTEPVQLALRVRAALNSAQQMGPPVIHVVVNKAEAANVSQALEMLGVDHLPLYASGGCQSHEVWLGVKEEEQS